MATTVNTNTYSRHYHYPDGELLQMEPRHFEFFGLIYIEKDNAFKLTMNRFKFFKKKLAALRQHMRDAEKTYIDSDGQRIYLPYFNHLDDPLLRGSTLTELIAVGDHILWEFLNINSDLLTSQLDVYGRHVKIPNVYLP